jgi:L,D-transpeptidase ErfK/SrfK
VLGAVLSVFSHAAWGESPAPPAFMPIAGEPRKVLVEPQQTLLDIAFENRVGYEAVAHLNPDVDPWIPAPGTVVELPTWYVLPNAEHRGLVMNVPEMRLYDFTVDPFEVFAAAIGDMADPSILGKFEIGAKRENPAWYVPASIRAERPDLPAVVPPGRENPLGSRWMTIGRTSYGIHGTNVRWSIGRMATHGCVRLYEHEIRRLYRRTREGTPIQLVYQPFKWGTRDGVLHLEAHLDVYALHPDGLAEALRTPRALGLLHEIDVERVWQAVEEGRGVPVPVGTIPEPTDPATSTPTS